MSLLEQSPCCQMLATAAPGLIPASSHSARAVGPGSLLKSALSVAAPRLVLSGSMHSVGLTCYAPAIPLSARQRLTAHCLPVLKYCASDRWQEACMDRDAAREVGHEQMTVISELQVRSPLKGCAIVWMAPSSTAAAFPQL